MRITRVAGKRSGLAAILIAVAAGVAHGQDPAIKIDDISFSTLVEADAFSKNESDTGERLHGGQQRRAKIEARGMEQDQCVSSSARKSYSSAAAFGEQVRRDQKFLGFELNVNARAEGGREERCTQCQGNFCAAPADPKFTAAEARSNVTATVVYKLGSGLRGASTYRFTVVFDDFKLEKAEYKILLKRTNIRDPSELKENVSHNVDAKPNDEVRLNIQLATSARSEDPSKKGTGSGVLKVRVKVEEAPILDAAVNQGFILNGARTTDKEFSAVGLLAAHGDNGLLAPHCTGTVVGPTTVLTAAHCVADPKTQDHIAARRLFFILGNDYRSGTRVLVESSQYPQGEPPERFSFNERYNNTLEDDVAVVHTLQPIGVEAIPLYDGNPRMEDNWKQMQVTIVGFGLNPSEQHTNPDNRAAGIQRKATIPLANVDNRTFQYSARAGGASTCRGDSGGPALLRTQDNRYRLMGITSYGAWDCTSGHSMRTDAYLNWIRRYIRN